MPLAALVAHNLNPRIRTGQRPRQAPVFTEVPTEVTGVTVHRLILDGVADPVELVGAGPIRLTITGRSEPVQFTLEVNRSFGTTLDTMAVDIEWSARAQVRFAQDAEYRRLDALDDDEQQLVALLAMLRRKGH